MVPSYRMQEPTAMCRLLLLCPLYGYAVGKRMSKQGQCLPLVDSWKCEVLFEVFKYTSVHWKER